MHNYSRTPAPGARPVLAMILPVVAGTLLGMATGCDGRGSVRAPGATAGDRGADDPYLARRQAMVRELTASGIENRLVLEALERVPRHEFVPEESRSDAYRVRTPLPIAESQTISAANIVAIMTEALQLDGDEKVLEIGTGSGYQAAVLGEIVPEVYSVEIRRGLADSARQRLEDLKSRGILRYKKIEVIVGDGHRGHQVEAPYDAIIVTAAPPKMPVELLNQLANGGRMVIPVGDFYQELQLIERDEKGTLSQRTIHVVRFVPMIGGE